MDYAGIIKKSWEAAKTHRVLWLIGFITSVPYIISGLLGTPQAALANLPGAGQASGLPYDQLGALYLPLLASFLIGPIGTAGVLSGLQKAYKGKALVLSRELSESMHYYWRILFVPILLLGSLALILSVLFLFSSSMFFLCLIPLLCLLFPVSFLIPVLQMFSYMAIITDDVGVLEAMGKAWRLIREKLGQAVLTVLIFSFISVVMFFSLAAINTVLIRFLTPQSGAASIGFPSPAWAIRNLINIVYFLASSAFGVFIHSLWLLGYQELQSLPAKAEQPSTA